MVAGSGVRRFRSVQLDSPKTATIKDVAAHAGVSVATVSRVLNRKSNVRQDTRDRVLVSVAALDFQPSLQARSMRARSPLVGLLIHDNLPPYVSEVEAGVAAGCRSIGYHLVVAAAARDPEAAVKSAREMTSALNLAGLVLFPPFADAPAMQDFVRNAEIPCVRLSAIDQADIPTVRIDEERAAFEMTRHLTQLGHREIGFIRGPDQHAVSALRHKGYVAALDAAGLSVRDDLVVQGGFDFESGVETARTLLAAKPRPTAIFASNDSMALGAMSAIKAAGLSIPDDISVAGFDDVPACGLVWPRLTTVRQPIRAMAETAVAILYALAEGAEPEARHIHRLESFTVEARESTAPPPA